MNNLYGYTNFDNAYLINNYPWGYTLKTDRKIWVETKKNFGDRVVFSTLNPKTNKWCKAVCGTYSDVIVLVKLDNGHISHKAFSCMYTNLEDLEKFLAEIDQTQLNQEQKNKIAYARAIYKTRENITFEIRAKEYRNIETGEIVTSVPLMELNKYVAITDEEKDKEQKTVQQNINKLFAYNLHNEMKGNN